MSPKLNPLNPLKPTPQQRLTYLLRQHVPAVVGAPVESSLLMCLGVTLEDRRVAPCVQRFKKKHQTLTLHASPDPVPCVDLLASDSIIPLSLMKHDVFQPVQHHPLGQYQQGAKGTHASQGRQAKGPWMRSSCLLICWSGQSILVSSNFVILGDHPK